MGKEETENVCSDWTINRKMDHILNYCIRDQILIEYYVDWSNSKRENT